MAPTTTPHQKMSESLESKLAVAKTALSTVGSVAATSMVARSVILQSVPAEMKDYLFSGVGKLLDRLSNQLTMVIDEFDGLENNEIYEAAEVYLGPKVTPTTRRLRISKPERQKDFNIGMEKGELTDVFNGIEFKWVWAVDKVNTSDKFDNSSDRNSTLRSEVRSFELTFHKKNHDFVISTYLPYILSEAELKKRQRKTIELFTSDYWSWESMTLDHPATFDTLAMDSEMKDAILKDLERFLQRREFYRKVGKAWKRGYLLYGPPGTGKSSFIAAIANFLNFDIYNLELSEVRGNSSLRSLLMATANKSILVVEDIDCTIQFKDRSKKKDDSSSDESKDHNFHDKSQREVRPCFIRAWSDGCPHSHVLLHPSGFRILATNYLGIKDHSLFKEIGELISTTEITPAEVAEQMLKNDEADVTHKGLVDFLHEKRIEKEEAKIKKVEVEAVEPKEKSLRTRKITRSKKVEDLHHILNDVHDSKNC